MNGGTPERKMAYKRQANGFLASLKLGLKWPSGLDSSRKQRDVIGYYEVNELMSAFYG
jgi:hypothetical protein